jgi:BirA family biotin operon repressor/biotin-[acetyl-CoA-carboxylase] ligase
VSRLAVPLLRRLGNGEFHSGVTLAAALGVTRSAVWKCVRELRSLGAEIHAVPNRGYRLRAGSAGAGLLDAALLLAALPRAARDRVAALDVAWSIPSTNATLLQCAPPAPGSALIQLAEHQTAGRGRRGRAWIAPLGGALCLSVGWTFAQLPRDVAALSLAVGVAVRRALLSRGFGGVGLKWPNDLVVADRKLGGILIELRAEAGGPGYVVIGVGLNVALGAAVRTALAAAGADPVDLASLTLRPIDRNALAAGIVAELLTALTVFTEQGFASFAAEWASADSLRGRAVRLESVSGTAQGIAQGVDAGGALQVATAHGLERFLSAEVTVRPEASVAEPARSDVSGEAGA